MLIEFQLKILYIIMVLSFELICFWCQIPYIPPCPVEGSHTAAWLVFAAQTGTPRTCTNQHKLYSSVREVNVGCLVGSEYSVTVEIIHRI